ncbi:hypothetical protein TNCV_4373571 [Trichonephila clavipes]|uniref:Uncharacterized protein n=1 Tax=Trichonephila clavipes TaxID=2585209 RepID=A0A8X6R8M6_TRICX|nr:hypothetical protein TNCV_4373571 [Trichonephila clavipes]
MSCHSQLRRTITDNRTGTYTSVRFQTKDSHKYVYFHPRHDMTFFALSCVMGKTIDIAVCTLRDGQGSDSDPKMGVARAVIMS